MRIGVVILNYFSREDTLSLYETLTGYPGLEICVVDNSCDPGEERALRSTIRESQLLISDRNRGYAGGNNLGIRHLMQAGELKAIALLNPDIELKWNIFPSLLKWLDADPELAAAGPRLLIRGRESVIYSDGGCLVRQDKGYLKPVHAGSGLRIDREPPLPGGRVKSGVDYINGSFILIRTVAFREVGLLDEKFFLYFEEVDWCSRARILGWKVGVDRDLTAWQRISEKGDAYQFWFFRGWLLYLNRYDSAGIHHLLLEQLKKSVWILRDQNRPLRERCLLAARRIAGSFRGYWNW
ncbi:MAG: hypothetical protein WD355_11525 [Balneolaceae bacterium]